MDIDKGVIRVFEKKGISQIQVNVQDTYNRTQCYMDESTLKVKRESGRSRGNEAPRIEILIPAGYGLDKLSLDMGAAGAQSLASLSPNWRLTQGGRHYIFRHCQRGCGNRDRGGRCGPLT